MNMLGTDNTQKLTSSLLKLKSQLYFKNIDFIRFNDVQRIIEILSTAAANRTQQELRLLQQFLESRIVYIQHLKEKIRDDMMLKLFRSITIEVYRPYQVIFNQGDFGKKMYFVIEGEVAILVKNSNPDKLVKKKFHSLQDSNLISQFQDFRLVDYKKQYDYFEEQTIEQRIPRISTAVAKQQTTLGVLTYESFQQVVCHLKEEALQSRLLLLSQVYPFSDIPDTKLLQMLQNTEEIKIQPNYLIYKKGQIVDSLIVIISGEVLIQRWETIENEEENIKKKVRLTNLGNYGKGSVFGDFELYQIRMQQSRTMVRRSQALSRSDCKIMKFSVLQILECLKKPDLMKKFDQYLQDKYEEKMQPLSQRMEILPTKNSSQIELKHLKLFRNNKDQLNFFRMIGVSVDQYQIRGPKSERTNNLKSELDFRDKSLLKHLNSQPQLKILNKKSQSSTFSLLQFSKQLKYKLHLSKSNQNDSPNEITRSNQRIKTESENSIQIFRIPTQVSLSPRNKTHRTKFYSKYGESQQ